MVFSDCSVTLRLCNSVAGRLWVGVTMSNSVVMVCNRVVMVCNSVVTRCNSVVTMSNNVARCKLLAFTKFNALQKFF